MTPPDPAYGSTRPALWLAGLRDRLQGRAHRARARWGRIRPPQGHGPLIWLRAPGGRDDVEVAVALMQALRERRSDTRLVLTYHQEHRDLLEAGLKGLRDMGFGYGPCDAGRAVRRVIRRLSPTAVIAIGEAIPPKLSLALERQRIRHLAYGVAEHGDDDRRRADPLSLLIPAQIEPTLGGLLRGGARERAIHWWHGPAQRELLQRWATTDPHGLLAVSGDPRWQDLGKELERPVLTLSQWDERREAVAGGTLLIADQARWLPALAVSADAIHLAAPQRRPLLQALAAGRPLSLSGPPPELDLADLKPPRLETAEAVLAQWTELRRSPFEARRLGDQARRLFWDHRRRAREALERLREDYRDW